ncbi:MAG: hypothetical protein ACOH2M_20790 [Cypionkella sp.]
MNRLLVIVALLVAFANVVSPAMAASIAGELSQPIVASAGHGSGLTPAAGVQQKAAFKPCDRKVNGKSIQCHSSPLLFPVAAGVRLAHGQDVWLWDAQLAVLPEVFAGQFRPPRSAVA